jgi:hypothetical protein
VSLGHEANGSFWNELSLVDNIPSCLSDWKDLIYCGGHFVGSSMVGSGVWWWSFGQLLSDIVVILRHIAGVANVPRVPVGGILRYLSVGGYHFFGGLLGEDIFAEVWISCVEVIVGSVQH